MVIKPQPPICCHLFRSLVNISLLISCFLCIAQNLFGEEERKVYSADFGNTRLFFYALPEKEVLAQQWIPLIRDEAVHVMAKGTPNNPITEVTPLLVDGSSLSNTYLCRSKEITEKCLGLKMNSPSQAIRLLLNFNVSWFCQNSLLQQTDTSLMIREETLSDWEMAKGTIAGILLQEEASKDRFLFPLFPKTTTSILYTRGLLAPPDPLPISYCHLPPLDYQGNATSGSTKGKAVSFTLQGVAKQEELSRLHEKSTSLVVNNPSQTQTADGSRLYTYPSGMVLKEIPHPLLPLRTDIDWAYCYKEDIENVEVYATRPTDHLALLTALKQLFSIDCPLDQVEVRHLIKRDGGFSRLSWKGLNIHPESLVIILNRSSVPPGYQHYHLAQDFTANQTAPWIQLYDFQPSFALLIEGRKLNDLSLTPLEEVLFRNASIQSDAEEFAMMKDKFFTHFDCFIFPTHY